MSSLHDQQTTSQHQDIGKRIMSHLKTYTFLIYYQLSHLSGDNKIMNLQKISFKLKDDKNTYTEKYGQYNKNIQINFYDIENQVQISNSLHDLKITTQESKTKLIFFSSQGQMVQFYHKAKISNINIQNIPICIYTSGIHGDFSKFLGWGQPAINNLSSLSINQIEKDVRKWVQSPAEKIDIWAVEIKVSEDGGSIEKLNDTNRSFDKFKSNVHKQLFMSNLSIGYHPHLLLNYEQKKNTKQSNFLNKLMYSVQGMKKFCCVGNSDMRQTTGVVKIDFVDDKGQHQILKYLREPQGDQDSQYLASKKQVNKRKVLSIVLSNIDRFFGQKIQNNENSKMNDQKLELITFQSKNQTTKISSISGHINMQFSPDHPVYVQINDSCYKLEKPLALKVQSFGKARIIINKEMLCC